MIARIWRASLAACAARARLARLLVEIEHGPVVAARERAQPEVGVARGRVADDGEHRVVGEAVGVGPRLGEIDAVLLGVVAHDVGLGRAGDERLPQLAGRVAVDELEPVGDQVVDAEVAARAAAP